MPGTGGHCRRSQGETRPGVSHRNAKKGPGKKHVKKAIRAFFLWGRTMWSGRVITTTAELASVFDREVIREVRQQVAHLRVYWTGLEGTGVTRDDTITQLCQYDQELNNEIVKRSSEPNQEEWIEIAKEESAALKDQIMQIRDTQFPVYQFPQWADKPSKGRKACVELSVVTYNSFSMMRAGRWNEILQDVAKKGIHVAFIQGVRQAEVQGRGARREG